MSRSVYICIYIFMYIVSQKCVRHLRWYALRVFICSNILLTYTHTHCYNLKTCWSPKTTMTAVAALDDDGRFLVHLHSPTFSVHLLLVLYKYAHSICLRLSRAYLKVKGLVVNPAIWFKKF